MPASMACSWTSLSSVRPAPHELLLELKRPAEALSEFETSERREPDRFRGIYGAALAAAQSGDIAKAKRYFARLVEVGGEGPGRPEVAKARAFLARIRNRRGRRVSA